MIYRNGHKTSTFMHVFMQIRIHKNGANFATSPAYFGYVRVAFFLIFGCVFPEGLYIYIHMLLVVDLTLIVVLNNLFTDHFFKDFPAGQ